MDNVVQYLMPKLAYFKHCVEDSKVRHLFKRLHFEHIVMLLLYLIGNRLLRKLNTA